MESTGFNNLFKSDQSFVAVPTNLYESEAASEKVGFPLPPHAPTTGTTSDYFNNLQIQLYGSPQGPTSSPEYLGFSVLGSGIVKMCQNYIDNPPPPDNWLMAINLAYFIHFEKIHDDIEADIKGIVQNAKNDPTFQKAHPQIWTAIQEGYFEDSVDSSLSTVMESYHNMLQALGSIAHTGPYNITPAALLDTYLKPLQTKIEGAVDAVENPQPPATLSATQGFNVLFDFTNKIYGDLDEIKLLMDNGQKDLAMKLLSELVHTPITLGGQTFQGKGMAELNFLQYDLTKAINDHADQWKREEFVQENPQLQAAIPQKLNEAILNYVGQMSTLFNTLNKDYVAGYDETIKYRITSELGNGRTISFMDYLLSLLSPLNRDIYAKYPLPVINTTSISDPAEKGLDAMSITLFSLAMDTAFLANMDLVNKDIPSHLHDNDEAEELLENEEETDNRYFLLGSDQSTQFCGVKADIQDVQHWAAAKDPYFNKHIGLLNDLCHNSAGTLHGYLPKLTRDATELVSGDMDPMQTVEDLRFNAESAYQELYYEMYNVD